MPIDGEPNQPKQGQSQVLTPQIENIEIIELLGRGGMSLVYKARQKQLDRIVAVKVLSNLGQDGFNRFQLEAKLTSALEHPNIVKTISFGVSSDGQPYLVMEYLEGVSLAEELKQHGRLKLQKFRDVFLPALSALNQAHQAGMVHRDIKPGNIMICRTDTGNEIVKLVDFGIAKVFGEGQSENSNLTKSGAVIGSPTYMSPEQCIGKPLDGRSDLYSLACVMYETLTGEPPFTGDSLLEVMQKHTAEPPPTVSDLSRKIDIRKELAAVTLWGLAKDPDKRPQTAAEFAKKLNEVLEKITLDKVPRARNTPQAMLPQFVVISLALLVLAVGAGFLLPLLKKQKESQGKANLSKFQVRHPRSEDRQFLDLMSKPIKNAALTEQLQNKAEEYEQKRDWTRAEKLWQRSIDARERLLGANHPDLAATLVGLAHCYYLQAKYSQAVVLYKRALLIRERALDSTDPAIVNTLESMASSYEYSNKIAELESTLKHELSLMEKSLDKNDSHLGFVLERLGICLAKQGKTAEAEPLLRRCLSILKKQPQQNVAERAELLYFLANSYYYEGKYKEAEATCNEQFACYEKPVGLDNVNGSSTLIVMGNIFLKQGKNSKAQMYFSQAHKLDEQKYGENNRSMTSSLHGLAEVSMAQGKYADAEQILKRAVAIEEKQTVQDKQNLLYILDALSRCYVKEGKQAELKALNKRTTALEASK